MKTLFACTNALATVLLIGASTACSSSSTSAASTPDAGVPESEGDSGSAVAASTADGETTLGNGYLALGDSVAFGENPTSTTPLAVGTFIGYPELVAQRLGLALANAACSGETSGGFLSATAPDNGCRESKGQGRLHTVYTATQEDFTVQYLKTHSDTSLVTLSIGANDLFLLQESCNDDGTCEVNKLSATIDAYKTNLATILSALRGDGGYTGKIVLLTYYVIDYGDALQTAGMSALNNAMTAEGAKVQAIMADGFGAMKTAAAGSNGNACTAGLLIPLSSGGCDVHPTEAGRTVLANAIVDALSK